MSEPITLAVLGAAALTQGVNFLYGQAGELLKRRRDRREKAAAIDTELAAVELAAVELAAVEVDEKAVEEHRDQLRELTERLKPYVTGDLAVTEPPDPALLADMEAVRSILELAYRRRITFEGETPAPAGPTVEVKVVATGVDGDLTVADAGEVRGDSRVRAVGEVGAVGPGGKVTGLRADVIGG